MLLWLLPIKIVSYDILAQDSNTVRGSFLGELAGGSVPTPSIPLSVILTAFRKWNVFPFPAGVV